MKKTKILLFKLVLGLALAIGASFDKDVAYAAGPNLYEYCYKVRQECGSTTVGTICGYRINGVCIEF